jgi:pilus assembly protein CpaE
VHGVNGEIITVYGARGGLGATTLAVNLAVQLAAVTKARVALADLDLQRGDVAAFLNVTPQQSLAAIAGASGEVDDLFLHHTLTRHPSGVAVLPAPTRIIEAGDRPRKVDGAASPARAVPLTVVKHASA